MFWTFLHNCQLMKLRIPQSAIREIQLIITRNVSFNASETMFAKLSYLKISTNWSYGFSQKKKKGGENQMCQDLLNQAKCGWRWQFPVMTCLTNMKMEVTISTHDLLNSNESGSDNFTSGPIALPWRWRWQIHVRTSWTTMRLELTISCQDPLNCHEVGGDNFQSGPVEAAWDWRW